VHAYARALRLPPPLLVGSCRRRLFRARCGRAGSSRSRRRTDRHHVERPRRCGSRLVGGDRCVLDGGGEGPRDPARRGDRVPPSEHDDEDLRPARRQPRDRRAGSPLPAEARGRRDARGAEGARRHHHHQLRSPHAPAAVSPLSLVPDGSLRHRPRRAAGHEQPRERGRHRHRGQRRLANRAHEPRLPLARRERSGVRCTTISSDKAR
jgi:hypothetical protein